MPGLVEILIALFVIGLASAGLQEMVKKVLTAAVFKGVKPKPRPMWWTILNAVFAVVIATALGSLTPFAWPWGLIVGLAAGTSAALLYRKARSLLRSVSLPRK